MSQRPLAELPPPPRRVWTLKANTVIAGTAIAAGCIYVGLRDPNTHTTLPPCPFKAMTGWDCPGCGMTRAAYALMHLDPVAAASHNLLFVIAFPAVLWMLVSWLLRESSGRGLPTMRVPDWAIVGVGVAVLAFGVMRNLSAFSWLDAIA